MGFVILHVESTSWSTIPSLERIQSYLDIEHEQKPTEAGIPPAAWPKSGELQVENLSARYSMVRRSFTIKYSDTDFCI